MVKKITAIVFIFICICIAWAILGGTLLVRTDSQDGNLRSSVSKIWGSQQLQKAPQFQYYTQSTNWMESTEGSKVIRRSELVNTPTIIPLDGSNIQVKLNLEPRRKGLLWYPTYKVNFNGKYKVSNPVQEPRHFTARFELPVAGAKYDEFSVKIGNIEQPLVIGSDGVVEIGMDLSPGQNETFQIQYQSQGLERWGYWFGDNVKQVKDFHLKVMTDFVQVDYPDDAMSPTSKNNSDSGMILNWDYQNLLSGVQIGITMPEKINPGPWASRVIFMAPVALFLFFFMVFIFSTMKEVKLHPMHYFFLGVSFFSFHLLLAYLVDHISVEWALVICSLMSLGLVLSYMGRVTTKQFTLRYVAPSQLAYLILFSYTFFLKGFTGLAITILCILTLFLVMMVTAKVDWEKVMAK